MLPETDKQIGVTHSDLYRFFYLKKKENSYHQIFDMKSGSWIETFHPTLKDTQEEESPTPFFSFATWKVPELKMNSSRYNASNKSFFEYLIFLLSIEVHIVMYHSNCIFKYQQGSSRTVDTRCNIYCEDNLNNW